MRWSIVFFVEYLLEIFDRTLRLLSSFLYCFLGLGSQSVSKHRRAWLVVYLPHRLITGIFTQVWQIHVTFGAEWILFIVILCDDIQATFIAWLWAGFDDMRLWKVILVLNDWRFFKDLTGLRPDQHSKSRWVGRGIEIFKEGTASLIISLVTAIDICMLVENLHDTWKLLGVIIELLKQRVNARLLLDVSVLIEVLLHIFGVFFSCQSLIDWLVSVDDEGNNDIDEDKIGELHESYEEEKDTRIVFLSHSLLIHVYDGFPVILPHQSKECIKWHNIVVEVKVEPFGWDICFSCQLLVNKGLVDSTAKNLKTNTCIDQVQWVECQWKV